GLGGVVGGKPAAFQKPVAAGRAAPPRGGRPACGSRRIDGRLGRDAGLLAGRRGEAARAGGAALGVGTAGPAAARPQLTSPPFFGRRLAPGHARGLTSTLLYRVLCT